MATVARLKAVISAEITGLESGLKKADTDIKKFASETDGETKKAAKGFEVIGGAAKYVGAIVASIGVGAVVNLGRAAIEASAQMDALNRGLVAVSGSEAKAAEQTKRLYEIAKLPGLGFPEAIQGSIRLQAAGLSAQQAERSLRAFGNAIAVVGGGKAELDGVTLALTQIAAKGKVSAEEINQLQERVPQIRQAMIAAFGTADTQAIQTAGITAKQFQEVIVPAIEQAGQAGDSLKNRMENLQQAWQSSLTAMGDAVQPLVNKLLDDLTPALEKVSATIKGWSKAKAEEGLILSASQFGAKADSDLKNAEQLRIVTAEIARLRALPVNQRMTLMSGGDSYDYEDQMLNLLEKKRKIEQDIKSAEAAAYEPYIRDAYNRKATPFIDVVGINKQVKAIQKAFEGLGQAEDFKGLTAAGARVKALIDALPKDAAAKAQELTATLAEKVSDETAKLQKKMGESAKKHGERLAEITAEINQKAYAATHDRFDAEERALVESARKYKLWGVNRVAVDKWLAAETAKIERERMKPFTDFMNREATKQLKTIVDSGTATPETWRRLAAREMYGKQYTDLSEAEKGLAARVGESMNATYEAEQAEKRRQKSLRETADALKTQTEQWRLLVEIRDKAKGDLDAATGAKTKPETVAEALRRRFAGILSKPGGAAGEDLIRETEGYNAALDKVKDAQKKERDEAAKHYEGMKKQAALYGTIGERAKDLAANLDALTGKKNYLLQAEAALNVGNQARDAAGNILDPTIAAAVSAYASGLETLDRVKGRLKAIEETAQGMRRAFVTAFEEANKAQINFLRGSLTLNIEQWAKGFGASLARAVRAEIERAIAEALAAKATEAILKLIGLGKQKTNLEEQAKKARDYLKDGSERLLAASVALGIAAETFKASTDKLGGIFGGGGAADPATNFVKSILGGQGGDGGTGGLGIPGLPGGLKLPEGNTAAALAKYGLPALAGYGGYKLGGNSIGAGVGAAAGWYFGGPLGAVAGGFVGKEAEKAGNWLAKHLKFWAKGGAARRGDIGIVGEDGPELVRFGMDAHVTNAAATNRMMSGSGGGFAGREPGDIHVTQHIYGGVHNAADLQRLKTDITDAVRAGLKVGYVGF